MVGMPLRLEVMAKEARVNLVPLHLHHRKTHHQPLPKGKGRPPPPQQPIPTNLLPLHSLKDGVSISTLLLNNTITTILMTDRRHGRDRLHHQRLRQPKFLNSQVKSPKGQLRQLANLRTATNHRRLFKSKIRHRKIRLMHRRCQNSREILGMHHLRMKHHSSNSNRTNSNIRLKAGGCHHPMRQMLNNNNQNLAHGELQLPPPKQIRQNQRSPRKNQKNQQKVRSKYKKKRYQQSPSNPNVRDSLRMVDGVCRHPINVHHQSSSRDHGASKRLQKCNSHLSSSIHHLSHSNNNKMGRQNPNSLHSLNNNNNNNSSKNHPHLRDNSAHRSNHHPSSSRLSNLHTVSTTPIRCHHLGRTIRTVRMVNNSIKDMEGIVVNPLFSNNSSSSSSHLNPLPDRWYLSKSRRGRKLSRRH
mmetsp:Transcript_60973/g.149282  ORF Transcript_60973/g.149282 Transcript_60973/m.149282 type:complete len:413 (+) Transcript_60973:341-1579(+)